MTKLATLNKELLTNTLKSTGNWKEDRYGNFTCDKSGKVYRVKFQDTSFRIESKVVHDSGYIKYSWVKIGGGYYKDLSFVEDVVMVAGKKIRKEFF